MLGLGHHGGVPHVLLIYVVFLVNNAYVTAQSQCATGEYPSGGECVPCPNGYSSNAGSSEISDCNVCGAGTFVPDTEGTQNARYVYISTGSSTSMYMNFVEIEAYDDKDVKIAPTSASQATSYGPDNEASVCIDGDVGPTSDHYRTCHTGSSSENWIQVDLGSLYPVRKVVIHNRQTYQYAIGNTVHLYTESGASGAELASWEITTNQDVYTLGPLDISPATCVPCGPGLTSIEGSVGEESCYVAPTASPQASPTPVPTLERTYAPTPKPNPVPTPKANPVPTSEQTSAPTSFGSMSVGNRLATLVKENPTMAAVHGAWLAASIFFVVDSTFGGFLSEEEQQGSGGD